MKVLGIDIGTTTISLVVLDPEQKKVWESRTISNGTFMETAREWERIQDVNKIVEKTRKVLEGLLHAYPEVSSIVQRILSVLSLSPVHPESIFPARQVSSSVAASISTI